MPAVKTKITAADISAFISPTVIVPSVPVVRLKPNNRHFAELAFLEAAYLVNKDKLKTPDERALYRDFERAVQKDLNYLHKADNEDVELAVEKVFQFGKETGWLDGEKHPGTVLSFCAEMIEQSPNKFSNGILDSLNKIVSHLEEKKELKTPSCWAGSLAAKKWEQMFV